MDTVLQSQSTKTALGVRLTMPSSPHEFFLDILAIFNRVLTNYWPIHRWSIDELSANCRWSIIERKAISAETHLERLSTVSRPSVVRLSSESRPAIDRVSTDYRPLYRLIDCLTLPTVNMIHFRSSADKVSCLKMISNESTSLRKTFSIKIMTVFPWDIPHSNSFLF